MANNQQVLLTEDEAKAVFWAEVVCYSEGIGPDMTSILKKFLVAFPGIRGDDNVELAIEHLGLEVP